MKKILKFQKQTAKSGGFKSQACQFFWHQTNRFNFFIQIHVLYYKYKNKFLIYHHIVPNKYSHPFKASTYWFIVMQYLLNKVYHKLFLIKRARMQIRRTPL